MTAQQMELSSLNKKDLHETCQNSFRYSSLDENVNQEDEKCISTRHQTKDDDTLTEFQGFMLLLPTYIGMGFLGLPYIVKLLGLWSGSFGLLFYGFLNELGILVLTGSTQRLTERSGDRFGDMGRVVEMSLKLGPPWLQPHARKLRFYIDLCTVMTYGLIMPDLISLMNTFGQDIILQYVDISDTVSIIVISVLLLPIYLTRRLQLLSVLATTANIVLLALFIISFQYICQDLPNASTRPATKLVDYITVTSFTNDAMFSYGGIMMVMPIRDRIKNKKNFDGWNGVLGLVLMIVTCFHVCCGFFGYLKFGEITQVNYLLNLPGDEWGYKTMKILSFFTLYCTNGMTVFLVVEILWTPLKERLKAEIIKSYGEYICRVGLLVLSCVFTILVPEFELLMSLTGCIGILSTTFVVPYIVSMLTLYGEKEPTLLVDKIKRKLTLALCVVMIVFGTYSMVSGIGVAVYMTLYNIVL
ncbi:neutral amino acid uniporter 4-like [Ylistrum balloti]|uniref:neutral amino acid uniporter 4-like n=1 Tax=Ylistrum balloti TaxID=509963 RepID=UPI002905C688|nr:neutral amino acid uniporter 4-like [Ylistrum balloti]